MRALNDYVLLQYIDEESKSDGGLFIVNTQTNILHAKVIASNCQELKEGDTVWVARNLIQSAPNFMEGKAFWVDKKNIYGADN